MVIFEWVFVDFWNLGSKTRQGLVVNDPGVCFGTASDNELDIESDFFFRPIAALQGANASIKAAFSLVLKPRRQGLLVSM